MRALPLMIAALILPVLSAGAAQPARAAEAAPSTSTIRTTDWPNARLHNVGLMDLGDLQFRNGRASSGANNCTMLPGGARPVYAEYLTEEPADSPVTEDALILIECGSDAQQQALIPVQLGFDQRTLSAVGFIPADPPPGPGRRMTFTSYAVDRFAIVTTVRRADGRPENRRYLSGGGTTWERV